MGPVSRCQAGLWGTGLREWDRHLCHEMDPFPCATNDQINKCLKRAELNYQACLKGGPPVFEDPRQDKPTRIH